MTRCRSVYHRALHLELLEPRCLLSSSNPALSIVEPLSAPLTENASQWHVSEWMVHIPDEKYLSAINIPGTHDTMASTKAGWPHNYDNAAACQDMGLRDQLDAGIRFLDIRGWLEKDGTLTVHHSVERLANLLDVMDTVREFLKQHPSESIVMSIKHEGGGSDSEFSTALKNFLSSHASGLFWEQSGSYPDKLPKMGEVRGKVVLMRRFDATNSGIKGIDATGWPDNDSKKFTSPGGVALYVQDHYKIYSDDKYSSYVSPTLNKAKSDPSSTWYVNFTSAAFGLLPASYAWGYDAVGERVNQKVDDYVRGLGVPVRLGTIVLNYPEYVDHRSWGHKPVEGDLVEHILDLNKPPNVWVDDNYGPGTPNWGITRFGSIADGMANVGRGGHVYVAPGDYSGNIVAETNSAIVFQAGTTTLHGSFELVNGSVDASAVDLAITGTFDLYGGDFLSSPERAFRVGPGFDLNTDHAGHFNRYTGSGTVEDPYIIYDMYGLQGMTLNVTSHFALAHDLDASVTSQWFDGFQPIGSGPSDGFLGSLNGHGFEISGLYVRQEMGSDAGLFAKLRGVVTSLGLVNATVEGNQNVGALAGSVSGTVSYCYSTGSVKSVDASGTFVGGLVGLLEYGGTVANCYSTASVSAKVASFQTNVAAGLVGAFGGGNNVISNCYAAGRVTGDTSSSGLVGSVGNGTVHNSYYDYQTTGQSQVDAGRGTPKTTAQMKQQATFSGWDFTKVWKIRQGESYPYIPKDPLDAQPIPGFGRALTFDGYSTYVDCGDADALSKFEEFTVEAWVKLTDTHADQKIANKFSSFGPRNYYILGVRDGKLYGEVAVNNELVSFEAGTVLSQQWTHLALTFARGDGAHNGAVRGYVNGDLVFENTTFTNLALDATSSYPFRIGAASWDGNFGLASGQVDEVRVWNVERSADEIRNGVYRTIDEVLSAQPTEFSNLVGYWQFDEGSGQSVPDVSRRGNNGAVNAPATWATSSAPALTVTDENASAVSGVLFGADLDRDLLSYKIASPPQHGSVTYVTSSHEFLYTPTKGWHGSDSFTFTVSDDGGLTWSELRYPVTIVVNAVDQRPVAGFGGALDFVVPQGAEDARSYVTVPPSLASLDHWTFSAWVRPLGDGVIYSECDAGGVERLGFAVLEGNLTLLAWGWADEWVEFSWEIGAVSLGQWSFVSVVRDGANFAGYINGRQAGAGTSNSPTSAVRYAVIGAESSSVHGKDMPHGFDGMLDEVRLWSVARSGSDLRNDMNCPLVGDEAGLSAYWRFDDKPGTSWQYGTRATARSRIGRA